MFSKIQAFLIPPFLKRLDFWLMTHKPHIWRTRGHFVVFYSLLAAILLYFGGRMYPQNFADFYDGDALRNNGLVNYLTQFLTFTGMGIVMWWWYGIQKFGYRRTNIVHFLSEIGIYTLGLFSILTFVLSFEKGFTYRQAYELQQTSREDSTWLANNGYFYYGYMPHFQANKEADLTQYFKDGELLTQKMYSRDAVVSNILKNDVSLENSYGTGSPDAFSLSLWEYPSNTQRYARPPQYKTPADYVNRILSNDTFWKLEEKRQQFKETDNVSREYLTNMTTADITNLIDEVYPKYFHRVNYWSDNQNIMRMLLKLSINKKQFLESLSPQEIKTYTTYLAWLKNNFALYAPQPIVAFEQNAGRGFTETRNAKGNFIQGKDSLLGSPYFQCEEYFDEDKGELAGEKLLHFFEDLDVESFELYVYYLQNETYGDLKQNKKNPTFKQSCQNYFVKHPSVSTQDSLYFYDYYWDKNISEYTWMYIIADEYAHFATEKYTDADYQRLRKMLHSNSFTDVYKDSKNPTIQKLLQFHQVEDYNTARDQMAQKRSQYTDRAAFTFSPFAVLCCAFFALIFYITTQSSGLQFWISAFASGFLVSFLMVAQKFISSNLGSYTSYPTPNRYMLDSINTNVSLPWDEYLMYFFGLLLLLAFIVLIVRKTQLLKVQIVFNVLIFSSLFGLFSTVNYWSNQIEIRKRAVNPNDYQTTTLDETIRLYIVILVVAIVLYAFLAWLYKRHLTYPKKK
jgi:hypothetical protein